ncbi:hypothetical protein Vretimale_12651 [Volvox reticuliferus]|uniref:Transmembrane protein n=1 Tax=Volvox reticuliferus TaxID=1737510 RepID=A0A8J4GIR9_9CHLO|nr:hypothetical protein Vretimale_12651 [Volvox reticuliferus]
MVATATHCPKRSCYFHGILLINIILHVCGYKFTMASLPQFSPGVIATAGKAGGSDDSILDADCAGEAKCSETANYWGFLRERQAILSKAKSSRTAFDTGDSDLPPFRIGADTYNGDGIEADDKAGGSLTGIWDWLRERQRGVVELAALNNAEDELFDLPERKNLKFAAGEGSVGHVNDHKGENSASISGSKADVRTHTEDATAGGKGAASINLEDTAAIAPTVREFPPIATNAFLIAAAQLMMATLVVGLIFYWIYGSKHQTRWAAGIPAVPGYQEARLLEDKTSTTRDLVQSDASDAPKIGRVEASPGCHAEVLERPVTVMSPSSFHATACKRVERRGGSDRDGTVLNSSISASSRSRPAGHAARPTQRLSDNGSNGGNSGGSDSSGDVGCAAVPEPSVAAEAACVSAEAAKEHRATTREVGEDVSDSSSDLHSERGCVSSTSAPIMPAAEASIPENGGAEDLHSCSISPLIQASSPTGRISVPRLQMMERPVVAAAQPPAALLQSPIRQFRYLSSGHLHEETSIIKNATPIMQQQQQKWHQQHWQQLQGSPVKRLLDAPWTPGAASAGASPVTSGRSSGDAACASIPDASISPYRGRLQASYDVQQLQVHQLQLQLTERHVMAMVETMMESFNSRMTEFVGVVSENTGAVQQLNNNMRRVISVKALEEQRNWVMACMQRGMVVMWISLVGASMRLGRLKDVAWTCSQDAPARAPEFGGTSVLSSTGWWGLRLTSWALGLPGWSKTPSGISGSGSGTGSSWSSWGWNQMASLLSPRLYPSFLKTALCYGQELGLQALGILLVVFLLHPLLRSMLSVNMRRSWRIDVPLILGGLWAVAGCVTIHCLGGYWTVWLAGWWIWCGVGYTMHMKELLSCWAKAAVAVLLVGMPVVIVGAAFVASALPVHDVVAGWLHVGLNLAGRVG